MKELQVLSIDDILALGYLPADPDSDDAIEYARKVEAAVFGKLPKGTEVPDPVGHLAWREGKPSWDEDCVCEDAVYPVDGDDDRESMPIFTIAQLRLAIGAATLRERERFATLVTAHALAQRMPCTVISAADIDPELLRDMLAKAKPGPIVAMPPAPDVAAAVAVEREACAKLMKSLRAKSRNHLFRSALTVAEAEIRARSTQ